MHLKLSQFIALLLLVSALSLPVASRAQKGANASDVIIMIEPQGAQTMMVMTFGKRIEHQKVQKYIETLLSHTGWVVGSASIKDEPDFGYQTGATLELLSAPYMRENGFWIQPFAETFQSLNRIELWYVVPPDQAFIGLRSYKDSMLDINLISDGNPYRYLVEFHDHNGKLPILPLTQPSVQDNAQQAQNQVDNRTRIIRIIVFLVAAFALGAIGIQLSRRRNPNQHPR